MMLLKDWGAILDQISSTENVEQVISYKFVKPLLEELGFNDQEWLPQFKTGNGTHWVDFAARQNNGNDTFFKSKTDPYLLIEVKARCTAAGAKINLSEGTPQYLATRNQLKKYLLGPKCKTAQWGIITNADHIQLFRRHGKVVIPATQSLLIKRDSINKIITEIKALIGDPPKALTVCIYNNKGGVGKTTTTLNLAAILRKQKRNVLVVDFDSQSDLTKILNLKAGAVKLSACLANPEIDIKKAIQPFTIKDKLGKNLKVFDVIPSDSEMEKYTGEKAAEEIQKGAARLRDLLSIFTHKYDYILIDCPTQWLFFSKSSVYASDVIFIPTKHNDLASLHNAAKVITNFIPDVKKDRKDGGPIALPIFFNAHKPTPASMVKTKNEIRHILEMAKESGFDLLPYYLPKYTKDQFDKTIFSVPESGIITSYAFEHIPAVLRHATVEKSYLSLAKEYFLYE